MGLANQLRATYGLRGIEPPVKSKLALVPAEKKEGEKRKVHLPVVQGEAPRMSVVSLIDRYMFSGTKKTMAHVVVPLNTERKQGVFHPSELCKESVCHRALAYELYSAPQHRTIDARLQRIFDNGHFVHARLQQVMTEAVKLVKGQFWEEVKIPPGADLVAGTTDGGFVINQWPYLLEIKSMNKKNFMELGASPWDEHYDQLNIYMHLTKVKAAVVLVECKDNQDLREYFVRYDPKRWQRIGDIVSDVTVFFKARELPPQVTKENGCDGEDCRFYRICKGDLRGWQPSQSLSATS